MTQATQEKARKNTLKRLVVLSDGTWHSTESEVPSNILRMTKAIAKEDDDGIQQVIMYDAGVGTNGRVDKLRGGLLGTGLEKNILELYTFLALNYDENDEVYMFGFSRGAYTVRSLAGMIYHCGLVRREHLDYVQDAYEMYHHRDEAALGKFMQSYGRRINIKFLGCFDTVGALGVPDRIFGLNVPQRFKRYYEFHDTLLNDNIEHAVHVLSIDENRAAYKPTAMRATNPQQVTRAYFWGTHSGIGGGAKSALVASNTTLFYMLQQLKIARCGLKFNNDMLPADYEPIARDITIQSDSLRNRVMKLVGGEANRVVPSVQDLHWTAVRRFQSVSTWRPGALTPFEKELKMIDWEELRDQEEDQLMKNSSTRN